MIKINEPNTESEIRLILFHYCKLWCRLNSNPFNEIKGIVLLYDICKILENSLETIKTDISKVFLNLKIELNHLFFDISLPPFLEDFEKVVGRKNGYLTRLATFDKLTKEIPKYLEDFRGFTLKELLKRYFDSDKILQSSIFKRINQLLASGYLPGDNDFKLFNELTNNVNLLDSQNLIYHFNKTNYQFRSTDFD